MKIYRCEQRSPEWYKAKDMKLTASNATAIMAAGKGLETLCMEILTKHYSSGQYEDFVNDPFTRHMQRGVEFEEKARKIYEFETGNNVETVGFIELDEYSGCSPDGLIGDYGLLEIKNLSDKHFMDLALTGKVDSNHRNQMQMQLYVTGRHWCDYFAFNPNFNPCYIKITFKPEHESFERLKHGLAMGKQILKRKKEIFDQQFKDVA